MSIGSSAADVSCQCHKVQKCTGDRGTSVGEWGRGRVSICDPGWAPPDPRGSRARRARRPAGRAPAPQPWHRPDSKRPRFFLCPWWQRSKRRGVAAGSRGAPQRACALLSCDAHCVCVPGAGLRTARTGQQGLAGLAEARLHRCLRRKSRLVVTGAQGSGRGGVQCELRRSLARAACTPRTVAGAPV